MVLSIGLSCEPVASFGWQMEAVTEVGGIIRQIFHEGGQSVRGAKVHGECGFWRELAHEQPVAVQTVAFKPWVDGQKSDIDSLVGLRGSLRGPCLDFADLLGVTGNHVVVPALAFPFPVPQVQISRVEDGLAVCLHPEGDACVRGFEGVNDHADVRQGECFVRFHAQDARALDTIVRMTGLVDGLVREAAEVGFGMSFDNT